MRSILVVNPKGGCGKTTIATHLAVYASTLGLDVALADHDAQHSSHDWIKSRPARCADIDLIAAYRGDAPGRNYDVVIHDLPAGDYATSKLPLDVCSKVVIPLMPSPIDLKSALQLWMNLSENGWLDNSSLEFGIVANRVKTNTKYLEVFNEFVDKLEIPRVATLRDTQNYIRSMDNGLTLFDLPPGRVVQDLVQWEPLMEWTGFFDLDDEDISDLMQELGAGSSSSDEAILDQQLESALRSLSGSDFSRADMQASDHSSQAIGSTSSKFLNSGSDDLNLAQLVGDNQWQMGSDFEADAAQQEFISLDDYQAEQLEQEGHYSETDYED